MSRSTKNVHCLTNFYCIGIYPSTLFHYVYCIHTYISVSILPFPKKYVNYFSDTKFNFSFFILTVNKKLCFGQITSHKFSSYISPLLLATHLKNRLT